jgi:hypothetical protein
MSCPPPHHTHTSHIPPTPAFVHINIEHTPPLSTPCFTHQWLLPPPSPPHPHQKSPNRERGNHQGGGGRAVQGRGPGLRRHHPPSPPPPPFTQPKMHKMPLLPASFAQHVLPLLLSLPPPPCQHQQTQRMRPPLRVLRQAPTGPRARPVRSSHAHWPRTAAQTSSAH